MSDGTVRTNPQLNCTLSAGLWAILQEHSRKTNEPLSHIVSRALADYLQVSHSTLYQVSTATALVEGIYQGAAVDYRDNHRLMEILRPDVLN
jgi:hypothetical protein